MPNVGQTLVLIENEGLPTQKEQYIRATAVSVVERSFTYNTDQDYKAAVVTVAISDALRLRFHRLARERTFTRLNSTKTRDTVVADAGTYVGVVPLTQAANVGDFTIKGASIYTQLVPSAQTETPISFIATLRRSRFAGAGRGTRELRPATPGTPASSSTCRVVACRVAVHRHRWHHDLRRCGPAQDRQRHAGHHRLRQRHPEPELRLDVQHGKAITYTPAAQLQRAPQSAGDRGHAGIAQPVHVGTVNPVPQPGTLPSATWRRAAGTCCRMAAMAPLKGWTPATAGTFNKNTGAFVVTWGTARRGFILILTWNVPTQETQQPTALKASQACSSPRPRARALQPGTLTVTWPHESGTGTRTASATTSGELSGAATGNLNVAQNLLSFAPNVLPPVGAADRGLRCGPQAGSSFAHPSRDGQGKVPVTATLGSIEPGSLEIEWNTSDGHRRARGLHAAADSGDGAGPVERGRSHAVRPRRWCGQCAARRPSSVASTTPPGGAVPARRHPVKIPSPVYGAQPSGWASGVGQMFRLNYGGINYVDAPSPIPNDESGYVKLRYNSAGSTSNHSETFAFSPSFRLVPGVNAQVVTGTVLLAIAGSQPWGDNGQGTLREFTPSGWVTRQHQLPLGRGDAHLVVGGRDQQHHARQLRDHRGREHLQRVRVPAPVPRHCAQDRSPFSSPARWVEPRP